jgi:hypothetical protein
LATSGLSWLGVENDVVGRGSVWHRTEWPGGVGRGRQGGVRYGPVRLGATRQGEAG